MRQKIFDGKSLYSPSLIQTFSVPENSETLKGSPTNIFGTVRQINFDGKSFYSPVSYLSFSVPEFSETLKSSPTNFFDSETNNFRRKILKPPPPSLMHKIVCYPKLSDAPNCSLTKFFGTKGQKILNEKS